MCVAQDGRVEVFVKRRLGYEINDLISLIKIKIRIRLSFERTSFGWRFADRQFRLGERRLDGIALNETRLGQGWCPVIHFTIIPASRRQVR